jgi:hypothetical protein
MRRPAVALLPRYKSLTLQQSHASWSHSKSLYCGLSGLLGRAVSGLDERDGSDRGDSERDGSERDGSERDGSEREGSDLGASERGDSERLGSERGDSDRDGRS